MEDQLDDIGVLGILRESLRIIVSCRKTLRLITLFFIFPLSCILLDGTDSYLFRSEIEPELENADPNYMLFGFLLFRLGRFFCFALLYLIATTSIALTVAYSYTGEHKNQTFTQVMTDAFQKLLNQQPVHHVFLWSILLPFAYNFDASSSLSLGVGIIGGKAVFGLLLGLSFCILMAMGYACASLVWHMATLIAVLEDEFFRESLRKSHLLMKGNSRSAFVIHLMLITCVQVSSGVFDYFGIWKMGSKGSQVALVALCFMFQASVILYGLVCHAVLYIVCKSITSEKTSLLEDNGKA